MIMIRKTNSSYYKAFCYKSLKKKKIQKKEKKIVRLILYMV